MSSAPVLPGLAAPRARLPALTLAALGVVYGDIGTSPLYAFKEAFAGEHALPLSPANVLAVLSMVFWAVTLVVSVKYVAFMLRFDHRGEGGVLALLAWATRVAKGSPRLSATVAAMGVFAASLFYGDAIITPAISVLSAIEGVSVATPAFEHWIVPLALVLLTGLFAIQPRGTARIGRLFGPVMVAWFGVLALLGARSIALTPEVLAALDPSHALRLAIERPALAALALSAVFLCLTGAEALYADMGHFGKRPVRLAWFGLVFPALMVNYFGQGALVLRDPSAAKNPFYLLAPEPMLLPMVALATLATIIASQATITGAYSMTQQASRLDFLPRLRVLHTSESEQGQIYMPLVNWLMLGGVLALVLVFQTSTDLAAAYGIAVNGVMVVSTLLLALVFGHLRALRYRASLAVFALLLLLELAFLGSNLMKLSEGGWFPLVLGLAVFTLLTTWRRGLRILRARKDARPQGSLEELRFDLSNAARVPRQAVFFSSSRRGWPSAFLHNLKHNAVLHETAVFLTIEFVDAPRVPDDDRIELERMPEGIWRVLARFGFREDVDVERVLKLARRRGVPVDPQRVSFYTSKPTVVSVSRRGPLGWRRSLFGWMLQNSPTVASYFGLPANRVVEMGTQIAI